MVISSYVRCGTWTQFRNSDLLICGNATDSIPCKNASEAVGARSKPEAGAAPASPEFPLETFLASLGALF